MDVTLLFLSDGFQWKLEGSLIKGSDRYLWFVCWLWFEFEVVKYHKNKSV